MTTELESGTLALCQELVRIESPSGGEQDVATAVERAMTALGYDEVRRDELGSVVGIVRGSRRAERRAARCSSTRTWTWSRPPSRRPGASRPSRPSARGPRLGPRRDRRQGLARRRRGGDRPLPRAEFAGTVLVSASVGEERIEGLALGHVLERHPVRAAIVCEPTGLALGLGHRGRAGVVIEAEGRAAHTSRAENGDQRRVPADRGHRPHARHDAAHRRAARPRPHRAGRGQLAALPRLLHGALPRHRALRPPAGARRDARERAGRAGGGAGRARGRDARLHAGELRCYTGPSFTVEAFHPGWAVPAEAEHARRARQALREAGLGDDVFYAPYSTNATATAGERGLPTLVYGAGEISAAHAVDESVGEAELVAAARGYQALARALA